MWFCFGCHSSFSLSWYPFMEIETPSYPSFIYDNCQSPPFWKNLQIPHPISLWWRNLPHAKSHWGQTNILNYRWVGSFWLQIYKYSGWHLGKSHRSKHVCVSSSGKSCWFRWCCPCHKRYYSHPWMWSAKFLPSTYWLCTLHDVSRSHSPYSLTTTLSYYLCHTFTP